MSSGLHHCLLRQQNTISSNCNIYYFSNYKTRIYIYMNEAISCIVVIYIANFDVLDVTQHGMNGNNGIKSANPKSCTESKWSERAKGISTT